MACHPTTLVKALLLFSLIFHCAKAQGICQNVCRKRPREAKADCLRSAQARMLCTLRRCRLRRPKGKRGVRCAEKFPSSSSFPSPTPTRSFGSSPIPLGRGPCPEICREKFREAKAECLQSAEVRNLCRLRQCRAGRKKGARCTLDTLQVDPSLSPNPSISVSPSPSSSRSEFSTMSFLTGSRSVSRRESLDGKTFDVSYDVTLADGGVVSLAAAESTVQNVECSSDGTVRIRLAPSVTGSVSDLFPVGSLLVIKRDSFGPCKLGEEPEEAFESANQAEFEDGYLVIEAVSGTPQDAIVTGTQASFFAMFENADMRIEAVGASSTREVAELPISSRQQATSTKSFNLGNFDLSATAKISFDASIELLSAQWGSSGINIELKYSSEFIIEADLSLSWKIGLFDETRLFDFISIPLSGIPRLTFFEALVSLPSLRLGLFFEAPVVLRMSADLEKNFGALAKISRSSGRKELVFFAKGPWTNIDTGVRTVKNLPPSTQSSFASRSSLTDNPVSIVITGFVGLRPQIVLYAALFTSRISVDVGAEVKTSGSISGSAFKPLPDGPRQFGVCDTCHFIRIEASLKGTNVMASGRVVLAASVVIFRKTISVTVLDRSFEIPLPGNPTVSFDLAKICLFREFGENTETCGMVCCDQEVTRCESSPPASGMGMCMSPSPSPSPSPSRTPNPTPTPPGRSSSCYTDPHIRTYDGLPYDCQASGEFILVKSLDRKFEVQARFQGPNTRGSVTKGLAVSHAAAPDIQVSMSESEDAPHVLLRGCPVLFYVDGNTQNILDGSGRDAEVRVLASTSGSLQIVYPTALSVNFRVQTSGVFGCYFEQIRVFLPDAFIATNRIVGLLGTPNDNPQDDWTEPDGAVLTPPRTTTERLFEPAYRYCTTNWCVRQEAESLFTYGHGSDFDSINECDKPFDAPPRLDSAPAALRRLCGQDAACLVDGLAGGIQDAENALNVQADVDRGSASSSALRFRPPVVAAEESVNVLITMDVSTRPGSQLDGLERFSVYRIDSESGQQGRVFVVQLEDDGEALNSDAVAGDRIFSNILAVRAEMGGELLGFRAIPVFAGREDGSSVLVVTALSAVRSYSRASRIGRTTEAGGTVRIRSIAGLEVVARYSWPIDERDLDTGTEFLGEKVGFACGSRGAYLIFSGDNTSSGGTETATIDVSGAREDGAWTDEVRVVFNAGWFRRTSSSPATLRTALRDKESGEEVAESGLSLVIEPGSQSGCSSTRVAELRITVAANETTLVLAGV